jgi:hypothetical protein
MNVKIVQLNARTNKTIDSIIAQMKKEGDNERPTEYLDMVDKVLRPYVHQINKAEVLNTPTNVRFDATISVMVAMATEYLARTTPKNQPQIVTGNTQGIIDDFVASLMGAVEANFGIEFTPLHAGEVAPGTGTAQ